MRGITYNDTFKTKVSITDTMDTDPIPTTFVHITLLIYTVCFNYISTLVFCKDFKNNLFCMKKVGEGLQ